MMTQCCCIKTQGQGYPEKTLAELPLSSSKYQSLWEENSLARHNDALFCNIFRVLADHLNFVQITISFRQALVPITSNHALFSKDILCCK